MDKHELYRVALQAELRSQELYRVLSRGYRQPETSAFFRELVRLEQIHEDKLRRAFAQEFPGQHLEADVKLGQEIKGLDLSDPQALLEFALSREELAQSHYLNFAAAADDPGIRDLLLRFAAEEEGHKTLLLQEMHRIQGALKWYDPSELTGLMED